MGLLYSKNTVVKLMSCVRLRRAIHFTMARQDAHQVDNELCPLSISNGDIKLSGEVRGNIVTNKSGADCHSLPTALSMTEGYVAKFGPGTTRERSMHWTTLLVRSSNFPKCIVGFLQPKVSIV